MASQDLESLLQKHKSDLRFAMPRDLRHKLIDEFATEPKPQMKSWLWITSTAVMTCLALVLTFVVGRFSAQGPRQDQLAQEIVSGHVRSLMANHLSDVISTDQHTVKPWFEGKLDFGPEVRDFPEYPLIGGRLDYIEQRSVTALVYKHGKHVINVFEWPSDEAGDKTPQFISQRGYHLFTWKKSGLQYWAVSDLNAADLQKFVEMWQ